MDIYIDFDDVLCETAVYFSGLVKKMFSKDIPYEKIIWFNLQKSFGLNDEEYRKMMDAAHSPDQLEIYAETPGASTALRKWQELGHNVQIVTGRPYSSSRASMNWLESHGLKDIPIIHVDKYSREKPCSGTGKERALTVEEFSKMNFDFAIEDSPAGLNHLCLLEKCRVAVFDRPWNRNLSLDEKKFTRCHDWAEIQDFFDSVQNELHES